MKLSPFTYIQSRLKLFATPVFHTEKKAEQKKAFTLKKSRKKSRESLSLAVVCSGD
jgi:hypothetical protein